MRSGRVGAVVLLAAVVMAVGILTMVLRLVTPGPPEGRFDARAPTTGQALTRKLALVVLDGVRHDVATDGRRMPRLSERYRTHANAELWAEPISMTASAALVFGTGVHAEIDLAIRNETSQPTPFDDLFTIARAAHLRTGTIGDPVWTGLYPNAWDVTRGDPHQLAVGVSDDEAAFLTAKSVQAQVPGLDLSVYHFPNPDHMAHGHGIASATYERYIADFDRMLAEFLDRFPADTTLIVVGDHGATMAGIHGSNTDEQRRTFIVAQGPGIVPGSHAMPRVDDVDIAPTMAALLGLPAPRHARGAPLVGWLDVPDDARAAIACNNVRDLARTLDDEAATRPVCDPAASVPSRLAAALPAARELDQRIGERASAAKSGGYRISIFATCATAVLGLVLFFGKPDLWRTGLAFTAALGFSVLVTSRIETLPGAWLTPARAILYVVFNLPLVLWLFRPTATARFLEGAPVLAPVVLPGLLVLTETHSALIESYVLAVVLALFALTRGIPGGDGFPRRFEARRALAYLPPLALGVVVCIDAGNYVPAWLLTAPRVQLAIAVGSLVAFAAVRYVRLRPGLAGTVLCVALGAVVLWLRRTAPVGICLAGWVITTIAALVVLRRGQRAYAELCAFAAYAWVSRDLEVPLLLATYLVAVGFGEAVARDLAGSTSRVALLAVISFAFAWGYVQLVGIQMGLHFMHMDFGAGTFRDPDVGMPRIVFALVYKYAVARGFLLFGLLLPLTRALRLVVLQGLVAVLALRATVLVASLEASPSSFWTPVWVTSELPHVLIALLMVAAATAFALVRAPHYLREAPAHV